MPPGVDNDTARLCPDPDCGGTAEPDQDGDHRYHECLDCGYTFGYQRVDTLSVSSGGTCAVGIPETTRRVASAPYHTALARTGTPLLQIGLAHAQPPA